jgi:MFS transporter, SP family, arabinose:H+ symporter
VARRTKRYRISPHLLLSTVVSSLAGFLFGYDNIVISGAIGYLARFYHLTPVAVGWAAGCALIGCLLGSASSGAVADRFGLKRALYACAFCFALSSLGVWTAATFAQFVGWRILGGVGIGAASIVAPMYIAEIAPAEMRGRLVVFYQLGIVTGILCAVYANMLIEHSGTDLWNVQHGWRWMFAVAALPAILFALSIMSCQESPRWLMKEGQNQKALQILSTISGPNTASLEVKAIEQSLAQEHGGLGELLAGPFRVPLLIGLVLAAFSQASGITSVLSFLPEILRHAGKVGDDAFFQAVLVGAVNLVFTIVAIWLVDRAGRKTLLLLGTGLQTLALASVGLLYSSNSPGPGVLVGIMLFVGGHAIGNGAVCWVIISEIFPTKVRGIAMSIATTALWASAYLANQFFPLTEQYLGSRGTFLFFGVMAALNFIFVLNFVPETRGYSLEEISRLWRKQAVGENQVVPNGSL